MDQGIRNKLRNVVTQCRKLLEDAVSQVLQGHFGIYASSKWDEVHVEDDARMTHLSDEDRAYRKDILGHFEHIEAFGSKPKDALDQLIREIAFTHLNRLCAYKMMETRGLIREAVSRELRSQGFLFYLADHPEDEQYYNTGHQDIAYRHFLDWLGGTLSEEIGVLFNPNDPANRLYPPQRVLDDVLALINDEELAGIWSEDETIGWVYQYFTPKELRDQARKESAAPRNSYELAFRNQFFTPRYVVEFLTDNTLGRMWYEMRRGDTKLTDQCRYMVRRPNENFLEEGQTAPQDAEESTNDLSQEELLKQPVYIPHRPKKDPRDLKILDPACGSGHFLLYCFDLLQTIYEEAYDDPDLGPALRKDYPTLEDLQRAVSGLILSHNLHGIDIDIRATQIAALALWLRCQRTYQEIGLKKERPKITRSNIVCAEPMPGETDMLKEFVAELQPKVLGQLVEVVFDKMKLAGEAGSLLKIEDEIREAVANSKKQWVRETTQAVDRKGHTLLFTEAAMDRLKGRPAQASFFDVSDITEAQFFEQAETKIIEALRTYAETSHNKQRLQRRLFSDDAVRGFAFVDLCRRRFDVVLMNPPFGDGTSAVQSYLSDLVTNSSSDLYAAFVERAVRLLLDGGLVGAITSRTGFFLPTFRLWRQNALLQHARPTVFADLGPGVLDSAMVETAAYCLSATGPHSALFFRLLQSQSRAAELLNRVADVRCPSSHRQTFICNPSVFGGVPEQPFCYWIAPSILALFQRLPRFDAQAKTRRGMATLDDFRFIRLAVEVPLLSDQQARHWVPYSKGESSGRFYESVTNVALWKDNGREVKQYVEGKVGSASRTIQSESLYFREGLPWVRRTHRLCVRVHAEGGIFSGGAQGIFCDGSKDDILAILGILSSSIFDGLTKLGVGRTGDAVQFEPGMIARVPTPLLTESPEVADKLRHLARRGWVINWHLDRTSELSRRFERPALAFSVGVSLYDRCKDWTQEVSRLTNEVRTIEEELNSVAADMYEIAEDGESSLYPDETDTHSQQDDVDDTTLTGSSCAHLVASFLSWCGGVAFGRFDITYWKVPTNECSPPHPFDPLPHVTPGLHQASVEANSEAESEESLGDEDGILVDDSEHQDDIERRVQEVLELIWKDRAEVIEKEACEILGVKTLRDYFRKPGTGGFWDDHVKRYSKSRRKAPIYWLLQSSKKNYALWLYYHRLDKDILFKALLNYVEPKIRLEQSRLEPLRAQRAEAGTSGREAKKLEKDIDRQEELISELRDFEDKLRRVTNLHLDPDLNDGVVLNIAPLRELVPWKEAKKYWDELLNGKYEWSSIGKQLRERSLVHGH